LLLGGAVFIYSLKRKETVMKKIVVGILAHVDAGKTTLSEGLLFSSGMIGKLGRVDKRDAYLDTYSLERERGITIFSKQATLSFGETEITLVDTPGHIDFSCEAERALSVQDYAILVVSASDGATSHTKTLWRLLSKRKIPTFIFVNKTDIAQAMSAEGHMSAEKEEGAKRFAALLVRFERFAESITSLPK
jgi:small GTP-binding protein